MKKFDKTTSELLMLDNILKYAPDWIYWKDVNSIHLGCSEEFAKVAGFKNREEMIGKSDYECAWSNRAEKYNLDDAEVIHSGKPKLNIEDTVLLDDGREVTVISNKVPLRNLSGKIIGVLGIATDITDRKKMEQDLKNAKEAAEAANHAKTEFIANMSHDIRTPLTGVIGMSEILENSLQNLEQKENAHMLHNSGEQLLSMLNGILDGIRAEHMSESDIHEEAFDLYQCIQDLVQLELPTTKLKHLSLQVDMSTNVPQYIVSDRRKIHRILLNFLGNSIKFTQSGHITIEVTCLHITQSSVHLQFGVADTGIGIPQEFQAHVFERFSRATPSYKGLYEGHGLGLHIAHSYVSLLGGHITLTSKEGVGTTFHFDLECKISQQKKTQSKMTHSPVKNTIAISDTRSPTPLYESQGSLKDISVPHLLLVEDSLIALKVLESIVTSAGFRFTSAENGEDAFEFAKSMTFNLMITDVGLPGISGNELALLIRDWEKKQDKEPLPIIGLTGHARDTAKSECLASGMSDVFSKPMSLDILLKIAEQYVVFKGFEHSEAKSNDKLNQSSKLGLDLPNTEDELFMLEEYPVFDVQYAFQQVGDVTLLFQIITDFISNKGQEDIWKMKEAYAQKDWSQVEKMAHRLKGGAVYIGTWRFQYACQYLERYYKVGHRDCLDKLYNQLLGVHHETLETLESWLQKYANI